ncbi:hypothetical protein B7R22_02400 [Subtercola boreus]|uniref:Uncharacterized protein n=1 Tax=Subtercola boreus TaxID=120213 RepID=A0A3E0W6F4_9MICO|nr:hypothetical protein B7R22_02400 [Subtercola boreus]
MDDQHPHATLGGGVARIARLPGEVLAGLVLDENGDVVAHGCFGEGLVLALHDVVDVFWRYVGELLREAFRDFADRFFFLFGFHESSIAALRQ